jgi:metal transporter CNNM
MGALSFKRKSVRSVMTPLRDCFMLAHNLRLNFQTMLAIYKSGFTRIPVFEGKALCC